MTGQNSQGSNSQSCRHRKVPLASFRPMACFCMNSTAQKALPWTNRSMFMIRASDHGSNSLLSRCNDVVVFYFTYDRNTASMAMPCHAALFFSSYCSEHIVLCSVVRLLTLLSTLNYLSQHVSASSPSVQPKASATV
jgi:hypothetical protein